MYVCYTDVLCEWLRRQKEWTRRVTCRVDRETLSHRLAKCSVHDNALRSGAAASSRTDRDRNHPSQGLLTDTSRIDTMTLTFEDSSS